MEFIVVAIIIPIAALFSAFALQLAAKWANADDTSYKSCYIIVIICLVISIVVSLIIQMDLSFIAAIISTFVYAAYLRVPGSMLIVFLIAIVITNIIVNLAFAMIITSLMLTFA